MRTLVGSTDDKIPDDIQKLNDAAREQGNRIVGAVRRPVGDKRLLWNEPDFEGVHQLRNFAANPRALETVDLGANAIETPYPLERWVIQAQAYSEDQAAKVSLLGRLFSGQVQRVKAGVIHDAKRFSIVKSETSREVEMGVAVRLSVATSKVSGSFELTLPNLAADAQLNGVEARVGITVLGFTGPLGGILPAPRKLDVETCAEYMEAFRNIQAFIFGKDGWGYVVPTALSYDE